MSELLTIMQNNLRNFKITVDRLLCNDYGVLRGCGYADSIGYWAMIEMPTIDEKEMKEVKEGVKEIIGIRCPGCRNITIPIGEPDSQGFADEMCDRCGYPIEFVYETEIGNNPPSKRLENEKK